MKNLTFGLLLVSQSLWAGDKIGNGGNVIACEHDGKITRVQLLDFFESANQDPKIKGPSHTALLEERLKILAPLAPKLAEQYKRRLNTIQKEWNIRDGIRLTKVDDSLHALEPDDKDCAVQQTVIRLPEATDGKRFVVSKRYWDRLDGPGRAGLMMHEIVYEHLFKLGAKDSRNARKIVGLIFSERFSTMTDSEFWLFIKELKIPVYP